MSKFSEFRLYLIVEKGLSELSASAYIGDLQLFESYSKSTAEDVRYDCLQLFLERLKHKKYATSSIARMVISLRVYQKYLFHSGQKKDDSDIFFETPKCMQLIPDVLTEDEVNVLLDGEEATVDQIVLEVIYACGLRVSELCKLNCFDIGKDTIYVKGKGQKDRIVPIAQKTKQKILDYIQLERLNQTKDCPLFVNSKGKRVTRQEVWGYIKKRAKDKGIQKSISPHVLRHSYATHMLDRGAQLRVIQELLGHKSITTTERYTHTSKRKLIDSFQQCHPLEDE